MTMTTTTVDVAGKSPASAEDIGALLQPVVADVLGIALHGKNAHWNISGPGFRSVHLGLDDLVAVAQDAADTLSERMRALGLPVDGTPGAVARRAEETRRRRQQPSSDVTAAVRWMVDLVDTVCAGIRGSVTAVAAFDQPTGDVLSQIVLDLEKQRWLLGSEL